MGPDGPARLAAAVARRERGVARQASEILFEVVDHGLPGNPAALGEEARRRLADLLALRDDLAAEFPQVRLTVDLRSSPAKPGPRAAPAVGERAYYDGNRLPAHAGRRLAVGGGGRYDRLFRGLGAAAPASLLPRLDRLCAPAPVTAR